MAKEKACPMGSKKQQMKHEMQEKKIIKQEKKAVNKLDKMHKSKKGK